VGEEPLKSALQAAHAELLQRIEDLSLVRQVGDALAGEVALEGLARALVLLLQDELGVDLAALWTVDELGGGLRLTALVRAGDEAAHTSPDGRLEPFAAGLLGRAAAGTPVVAAGSTLRQVDVVPAEAAGVASLLLYPVSARQRTLGVIGIGVSQPPAVGAEHERVLGLIAPVVALALESAGLYQQLACENRTLRAELQNRYGTASLIGASPAFCTLLENVRRLADADITVLVLGPSGTGKEIIARALHAGSPRRAQPFVAINCAALPEALLESELFGIERGVATGVEQRAGLIERAAGGTLFLDEIGDMSAAVQAKVLRVLQEREVMRVGGVRGIAVDVRVVAATHQDLATAVRAGRFREDLYFRLKVATLLVPALRERVQDIPLLVQHFLARFAAKHGRAGLRISSAALAALIGREWPGNVRELENAVERAVVMARGPILEPADFECELPAAVEPAFAYRQVVSTAADQAERAVLERALEAAGRNRTRAARLLGIGRRTLLYKLKRHGLG
jgi:two-component system response regulator HydG